MAVSKISLQDITLSNGLAMPTVGLGTWRIRGAEETAFAVEMALDVGYRLIDTAAMYDNEADIGAALKKLNVDRKKMFITSKLMSADQGKEKAEAAIEKTLSNLGTDYLDLYLIHWPGVKGMDERDERIKSLRLESWKVMEDFYKRGVLKAIGVSNYEVRHLEEVMSNSATVPHVNQIEIHPHFQNREVVEFCKANNIHTTAYTSMGRAHDDLFNEPSVVKVAEATKRTPGQVLLRWGIQKGYSVIPKSVNEHRILDNIELDSELSPEQMKMLDDISHCAKYAAVNPRNVI